MPETHFEAVVIGSGFGGTIAALTLANYFSARDPIEASSKPALEKKKVCLLERGRWWISHELPDRPEDERKQDLAADPSMQEVLKPNMREFLKDKGQPFGFWAHPDNSKGLVNLAFNSRLVN